MNKRIFAAAFAVGLASVIAVGWSFAGSNWLALAMTVVIGAAYLFGAAELRQFRVGNTALSSALAHPCEGTAGLPEWLERVPSVLRNAVRSRVEGERIALPGPALTPYLVGLLVMLGMLGTFLGMVVTFKGAMFALERSTDLQAIRSALGEPIKGLALSFGTSVAGVAASAMLGLMSAVARRERLELTRQLDTRIATDLRPYSLAHQRHETFRALQAQATALPQVVDKLEAMMERMEQRSRDLDDRLLARQDGFHRDVTTAYSELARGVGASLHDSLAAGARAAGETIAPVVESAMSQIVQESRDMQERLAGVAQAQVDALSQQFAGTARTVSDTWTSALERHAHTSEAQQLALQRALESFTGSFEQRSAALVATVDGNLERSRCAQATLEQERLQAWTGGVESMAARLEAEWQRIANETMAQQRAVCEMLEKSAAEITETASTRAIGTLQDAERLLATSEELVRSRIDSEAQWGEQQAQRMDQLAGLWRTQMDALRQEESERGEAAVQRLGELEAAVAQHLATLGAALEAPLTRLLHTASEVPQAAAGIIVQLREQMSGLADRDNLALQERTMLLEQLGALLQTVNVASGEQRAAVDALVASASTVMDQAANRFAQVLDAQAGQAQDVAAHVSGSAIELSSLAEAFGKSVQLFQAGNDKLLETLQHIQGSIDKATARSDEQLAYYVAQAREVIDLSIASQHGLVENLRQLQGKPARTLAVVGGAD